MCHVAVLHIQLGKLGTLQCEVALTCLWGYMALGNVPRGKSHIQDGPQQLRGAVQCDRHNQTASCPSQTGDACKQISGLHTLLVMLVMLVKFDQYIARCSYINISVFSFFIK
jgi:hypothetical protein